MSFIHKGQCIAKKQPAQSLKWLSTTLPTRKRSKEAVGVVPAATETPQVNKVIIPKTRRYFSLRAVESKPSWDQSPQVNRPPVDDGVLHRQWEREQTHLHLQRQGWRLSVPVPSLVERRESRSARSTLSKLREERQSASSPRSKQGLVWSGQMHIPSCVPLSQSGKSRSNADLIPEAAPSMSDLHPQAEALPEHPIEVAQSSLPVAGAVCLENRSGQNPKDALSDNETATSNSNEDNSDTYNSGAPVEPWIPLSTKAVQDAARRSHDRCKEESQMYFDEHSIIEEIALDAATAVCDNAVARDPAQSAALEKDVVVSKDAAGLEMQKQVSERNVDTYEVETLEEHCVNSEKECATIKVRIPESTAFASPETKVGELETQRDTHHVIPKGAAFVALEKKVEELQEQIAIPKGHQVGELDASQIAAKTLAARNKTRKQSVNDLLCAGCLVQFTHEEKEILRGFFELHDDDGSNSLSLEELVAVTADIGRVPPKGSEDARQFENLMRKADADGSDELNFAEFTAFLAEYYRSVYARLFVENDLDGSGTITSFEVKGLMLKVKDCGFKVRGEDIANLFKNIDMGDDGVLDWAEFCEFMCQYRKLEFDLLKVSAGFSSVELEYLLELFERADADHSGQLNIVECLEVLEAGMLPDQVDTKEETQRIAKLFSRMDKDRSMTLDLLEYLRLLRVWSNNGKDAKIDIMKVFKGGAEQSAKTKQLKRASTVKQVAGLGLGDEQSAELQNQAEKLHDAVVARELEDSILASSNNLAIQEVQLLRESFEFCDSDGSGSIDPDELNIVMKNLGCAAITAQQKKAFSRILERDVFKSDLDFPNLLQFLLAYHEACVQEVLLCVNDSSAEVALDKLGQVLYQLGQYAKGDEALATLEQSGGDRKSKVVSKCTILKMLDAYRLKKLIAWRETCGFSESQLAVIRHAFREHGDCHSINRDGAVLKALQLLNLAPPPEKRDKLLVSLLRVDRQGEGTILFQDFLLLVRHLENDRLYKRTAKEKETAKVAGLDADAIEQFRQVFNACEPNLLGKVEKGVIRQLFVDLGLVKQYRQKKQLKEVIEEVIQDDSGVEFSQFLDILHRLESKGIC